jgi:hypothetical protein
MGYTHYFTIYKEELPKDKWKLFIADVSVILAWAKTKKIKLTGCSEGPKPIVDGDLVFLNGEPGCETLLIRRRGVLSREDLRKNYRWEFCKTDRLPYDAVVCLILVALKHRFGKDVMVTSDGSPRKGSISHDWSDIFIVAKELLGLKLRWTVNGLTV